jgi:hypothetical protein
VLLERVGERGVAAVGARLAEALLQLVSASGRERLQLAAQAVIAILGDEDVVGLPVSGPGGEHGRSFRSRGTSRTHHRRPPVAWGWGRDPIPRRPPQREAQSMQSRTRNPLPADALLFVVVGSLLATVAAVWLMVTISEGWAVVLAIAIAITGVVSLMAVMNRELDEDDDDSPSD